MCWVNTLQTADKTACLLRGSQTGDVQAAWINWSLKRQAFAQAKCETAYSGRIKGTRKQWGAIGLVLRNKCKRC